MFGSTYFGRLSAHHQERTTALGAYGFTVGAWWLEHCWSWSLFEPDGCYCLVQFSFLKEKFYSDTLTDKPPLTVSILKPVLTC